MLDHDVTHNRTYRYGAAGIFPFGRGLSLTTFELAMTTSTAAAQPVTLKTDGSSNDLQVTVTVTNTGGMAGDEVVQAYLHPLDVSSLQLHPIKTLFGVSRLDNIAPAESAAYTFSINVKDLLLAAASGDLVSAPGSYRLTFESGAEASAGDALSLSLLLVGEQIVHDPFPAVPLPLAASVVVGQPGEAINRVLF